MTASVRSGAQGRNRARRMPRGGTGEVVLSAARIPSY
jgi:hypothetical protein